MQINQTAAWAELQALSKQPISISEAIATDSMRASGYALENRGLYFSYAKSLVNTEVLKSLLALAEQAQLKHFINAMFRGDKINTSEQRAVLHTALRDLDDKSSSDLVVDGQHLATDIQQQLQRIKQFSDGLRAGEVKGFTGSAITDVINIGIGGSNLGPKMVIEALSEFKTEAINLHFISNVDGACVNQLLKILSPETSLVIVQSKTFTTAETLANTQAVINWFKRLGVEWSQASKQFVAVTANRDRAVAFGIQPQQIFKLWDWVGGRYSLWSAVGLPIMISIGYERFMQLLAGANAMDEHFKQADFKQNMPVIMALIGVWYRNFLNMTSYAILPYCQRLAQFPAYIQQLDMESNGKSVTGDNKPLQWQTGPVIWGQSGTDGQHAFHQLLHQGTDIVPIDFIAARSDNLSSPNQHKMLLENMLAQSAALMAGRQSKQAHRCYTGNRPSNVLIVEELSPFQLGQLIALYEHKVFVQGVIWQINSFDQWGVELGKELANSLASSDANIELDAATKLLKQRLF